MSLGEYVGSGSGTTRLLMRFNGDATDSSGNGNNGTEYNITYVNDRLTKCGSFNGTTSGIKVSNHSSLNFRNECTFSVWFKANDYAPGTTRVIAAKWGASNVQNQYSFALSGDIILLTIRSDNGSYYQLLDTQKVRVDIWQNAIYSCDSTTMRLYVDGVYKKSKSWHGTVNLGTSPPDLGVGYYTVDGSLVFNGLMDELIIESRAWSHSEIIKYYTNTMGRYGII
jgi:hypothetical protein